MAAPAAVRLRRIRWGVIVAVTESLLLIRRSARSAPCFAASRATGTAPTSGELLAPKPFPAGASPEPLKFAVCDLSASLVVDVAGTRLPRGSGEFAFAIVPPRLVSARGRVCDILRAEGLDKRRDRPLRDLACHRHRPAPGRPDVWRGAPALVHRGKKTGK